MVRQRTEVNNKIRLFLTHNFTRKAAGSTLAASAPVIGASGTVGSAGNLAALSKASAVLTEWTDQVLKDIQDFDEKDDTKYVDYIARVEKYPNHRLPDKLTPCSLSGSEWQRVQVAAQASTLVYGCLGPTETAVYMPASWNGTTKTMTVETKQLVGANILVVAIRGSVGVMDWAVNANSEPADAPELGESSVCHRGFLDVARRMEGPVTQVIRASLPPSYSTATLLFTGHSAGAAIAQLLFASSHSGTTSLSRVASSYQQIDCITFGGPPIAAPPISCPPNSLFLSFVNEGDPVPLAQTEYVKSLMEVYAVPSPAQTVDLPLPVPFYGFSGTYIVLRDMAFEESEVEDVQAFTVNPAMLTRVIFGNFEFHSRDTYLNRVNILEERAAKRGRTLEQE